MGFLTFLFISFIVLLLFIAISTIIKVVLLLITKYKYDNYILILPSILAFCSWLISFTFWYFTLTKLFKINIVNLFYDIFINKSSLSNNLRALGITTIIYCFFGIVLQAISFLSVNIDYLKFNGYVRVFTKNKIIKRRKEKTNETGIIIDEQPSKLSISNAFISSLFTFSSIFFLVLILLSISNILAQKILN